MSTPARIDELRKKFDENPRRYFAPLANEYRKAGDLPQAIALCREHLPKQPGHMSGHIVYGQALYEAGDLGEARTVFESALALDPENLIALRHLGDIAKAGGDASAARRWYERVLDADPRNDDIAAQLAILGTASATPAAPMPSVHAPFAPPTNTPAPDAAYGPLSPTPAFGMGALPTPDSAMRAVDFDVVNAEIARYTPLGIDAIDSSVRAEPPHGEREVQPELKSESRPVFEPLDLDAMEAIGERSEGAVSAAAEPIGETTEDRTGETTAETIAEPTAETLDEIFEPSETVAQESGAVDFEEGIFAPEWPADTADIIASIATPRTVTPLFVNVTPDDAVAFGREPHEVPAEQFDDELTQSGEPDVSGGFAQQSVHEVAAKIESAEGESAEGESAEGDATEGESSEEERGIEHAWFDHDRGEHTTADDGTAEGVTAEVAPAELASAEVASADVASADHVEAELAVDHVATDDMSFADLAAGDDAERATVHAPDPMPGFATETMGELLVAQGFLERAADVYEELVRRRPYDPVLTSRLAELRERLAAEAAPGHSAAERNTPLRNTPLRNTPLRNTPLRNTPLLATPVRATPFAANAEIEPFPRDDEDTSSLTSRELFARIAARRVPRRTPPHVSPAVTHEAANGLASLFGGTGPSHDDAAAQALADAFAPISAHEMATGAGLDLDFGTPEAAKPSPVSSGALSVGAEPSSASGMHASAPSTPASNAGFSFDRFFPDPARSQERRAESAPADAPAPAGSNPSGSPSADQTPAPGKTTEDLAQFSAWLKGLGGS